VAEGIPENSEEGTAQINAVGNNCGVEIVTNDMGIEVPTPTIDGHLNLHDRLAEGYEGNGVHFGSKLLLTEECVPDSSGPCQSCTDISSFEASYAATFEYNPKGKDKKRADPDDPGTGVLCFNESSFALGALLGSSGNSPLGQAAIILSGGLYDGYTKEGIVKGHLGTYDCEEEEEEEL
jgi:hypothetical protein